MYETSEAEREYDSMPDEAPVAPAPPAKPIGIQSGVQLTAEQLAAVEAVRAWYRTSTDQTLTLGGYAGTGKTTIIRHLLDEGAVVLAPTGKAAQVLNRKGVPAQTIHSWLYEPPDEDDEGELVWRRLAKSAPFVICDESSMIATEIYQDLLATGARLLFVGDHGQLEPVGDNPQLMANPQVRLETIMRQAADSPILSLAHQARVDAPLVLVSHPDCAVMVPGYRGNDAGFLSSYDVVLTAFNRVRCSTNVQIRAHKGIASPLPVEGDRLICLRNNKRQGLCNGQLGTVVKVGKKAFDTLTVDFKPDGERVRENLRIYLPQLGAEKTLPYNVIPKGVDLFDYGYCITVHKSQGSEWDRVLVLEPPNQAVRDLWSVARWRYTAMTRAARHLTYLSPNALRASQVAA